MGISKTQKSVAGFYVVVIWIEKCNFQVLTPPLYLCKLLFFYLQKLTGIIASLWTNIWWTNSHFLWKTCVVASKFICSSYISFYVLTTINSKNISTMNILHPQPKFLKVKSLMAQLISFSATIEKSKAKRKMSFWYYRPSALLLNGIE